MIPMAFLSLFLGFILNEEMFLKRLTLRMRYNHEGWLILNEPAGILIGISLFLIAFIKAYGLSYILTTQNQLSTWLLSAGMYVLGNVLASKSIKGLFFSPYLAILGIVSFFYFPVIQMTFTAGVLGILFTKHLLGGLQVGKIAFSIALVCYVPSLEAIFLLIILSFTHLFSRRQSPFLTGLIR